jgi:hypothetical protein
MKEAVGMYRKDAAKLRADIATEILRSRNDVAHTSVDSYSTRAVEAVIKELEAQGWDAQVKTSGSEMDRVLFVYPKPKK